MPWKDPRKGWEVPALDYQEDPGKYHTCVTAGSGQNGRQEGF